ncbi:DUF1674 domain-containing protein [Candidatus Phycosocius spiralis]|uniref:DUF1674 domain-containing protein n=1 Tax=Candidatus Phycosocius spiralis TaxID=2815099 RepID=A0ABQ4PVU5_9PROT|nr:DUF1674 domain-containing protein [Candidatus Phycosocius spiralis]GIU66783.1 DUF1674 domain-containing protein [Candidatus Phycosocius spiralis]
MPEKSHATPPLPSPLRDELAAQTSSPAQRALAEAQARQEQAQQKRALAPELNGPKGAEPTRFGDWERKGIAYDF